MAYCLKKPKPICSAYEETELVLQTDKGLYEWAQAHQNDTEGVNILPLKTSNADVEMPVGSSTMPAGQRQLPTLFSRIDTSGLTGISAGGVSNTIPLTIGQDYSLAINRLSMMTNLTNVLFAGGYLELIVDQTYGNTLWSQNQTPDRFSDFIQRTKIDATKISTPEYPDMLTPAQATFTVQPPPTGISGWSAPGVTFWFNLRHAAGVPQGIHLNDEIYQLTTSPLDGDYLMIEVAFILRRKNIGRQQFICSIINGSNLSLTSIIETDGRLTATADINNIIDDDVQLNVLHHLVILYNKKNNTKRIIYDGKFNSVRYSTDINKGIAFRVSNERYPSLIDILLLRTYNTHYDDDFIIDYLWNNGNPLDVIIPYALTVRDETPSAYKYGCVAELLPWTISDTSTNSIKSTITSSNYNGIFSLNKAPFECIFKSPEFDGGSIEGFFVQSLTAGKVMLNKGNKYLPYLPSPADLLNSLSPTDTTLPTITVNVEQSDESTHTVILSSEADTAGKVRYDLGWIFKSSFLNEKSGYYDKNLYGNYTVNNIPGEETTQENASRLFTRHISQYGHISDMQTNGVTMLMSPACWIWYEGYPLIMAVNANSLTVGPYLYGASFDGTKKGSQLPAGITVIDFSNTYSWEIRNTPLSSISYFNPQYYCLRGCIPPNPFYVRWINEKGGYDFWMFKAYPSAEQEIEDIINTLPYPSDQYRIWHRASAIGRKRITVGDGLLTREEFECLKFIPRSPLVEWYDESIGKWQTVVFEDSISVTWNSRSGLGDIEYTFTLPPIRLQQL